jgi:anti-anti-sigma factor
MVSPATRAELGDAARHTPVFSRDDQLPLWSCTTELTSSPDGIIVMLRVSGEIDLLNHLDLRIALTDCVNGKPGYLIVDLAAVTFCWAEGLALLVETAALATANGTGYVLSGLPATLRRHCTALWGDALPTHYRTTAMAVSAIHAGRAEPCD